MRVSTSMQFSLANGAVERQRAELLRRQEQIATGRKVNSLGQDPVGARKILREESTLREVDAGRRAALEAELTLQQSDAILADVSDALQRTLEVAVRMGNDTFSAADREISANEVAQIRDRLVELGNMERNGRFLFAGLGNQPRPFSDDGTFRGDTGQLEVPVGRGARIAATLPGGEPFVDPMTGDSVFDMLDTLETALRADDGDGVRASVDRVRENIDRAAAARQEIGHRFERLENVLTALDRAELTASATLQQEKDTDFTEAVLELQQSEAGMRSALLITARLNELNLTNFLG